MKAKRKGFTLVELVVVIAVVAILAAVLIPTFVSLVRKANVSADTQLVRNLNTALASDGKEHDTMTEALQAAAKFGYDVGKINASATDNEILWDSKNDVFCYLKDGAIDYIPNSVADGNQLGADSYKLWKIYNKNETIPAASTQSYSIYYNGAAWTDETPTVSVGFDAGESTITSLTYTNTDSAKDVVIRTNGGTLNVGAASNVAQGQIRHYGIADTTVVYTETKCFHAYGAIGKMELKAGKAIAEKGGIVYLTEANAAGVVQENQGKIIIPAGVTTTDVPLSVVESIGYDSSTLDGNSYDNTKRANSAYEIGNLETLETFRDLVNGGFSFAGCTAKLTADIRLNDGWTPIGEGSRDVSSTKYEGNYVSKGTTTRIFAGTFDGNGKTISNLNAKGYTPKYYSKDATKTDSWLVYTYGFFGVLSENASVKNLTFDNVDIDLQKDISIPNPTINDVQRKIAKADSVAALVGYVSGSGVKISDITVKSGSVKAADAVAGIIGRWYNITTDVTLTNLTNKANVTAYSEDSSGIKAAGVVGYVSFAEGPTITLSNCHNTGNVSSTSKEENGSAYGDLLMCITSSRIQSVVLDNCSAEGSLSITAQKVNYTFSVWYNKKPTQN